MNNSAGSPDPTLMPLDELEAAISVQKQEVQQLYKSKDFAKMPAAQQGLARLLRAKADYRHR
jgi:hypothetical protein